MLQIAIHISCHPLGMQSWIRAAAGVLAAALAAAGQSSADPCRLDGMVRNGVTGQPVRKARVSLAPASGGEAVFATTDGQGRYSLSKVPAGSYRLTVTRDGFISQRYGAKR